MYRYGISFPQKRGKTRTGTNDSRKNDRNGGMEMTKWWVELGDLYVSSELIERILKEHEGEGDEDEGI